MAAYGLEGDDIGVDIKKVNNEYLILGQVGGSTSRSLWIKAQSDFASEGYSYGNFYSYSPVNFVQDKDGKIVSAINYTGNMFYIFKNDGNTAKKSFALKVQNPNTITLKCNQIKNCNNGDLIVVGEIEQTDRQRMSDMFVLRMSSDMQTIIWSKVFGTNVFDSANSIEPMDDGGFVVVGTSAFSHGETDIHIIKIDGEGNLVSAQMIGGSSSEYSPKIVKTSDGFYIAGNVFKDSNLLVAKLNQNADLINSTYLGSQNEEKSNNILALEDGSFILIGSYNNATNKYSSDILVAKIKPDFSIEWSNSFGGCGIDYGNAIVSNGSGGFQLVGAISNLNGKSDIIFASLNSQGKSELNDLPVTLENLNTSPNQASITSNYISENLPIHIAEVVINNPTKESLVRPQDSQPKERKECP